MSKQKILLDTLNDAEFKKNLRLPERCGGQIDDPDSQKSKKLLFTRGNGVFRVFDEL